MSEDTADYQEPNLLTPDAVWDILVEHCGASEAMREDFRHAFDRGVMEFRFCGSLGFGGKVYAPAWFPRVGYYREDDTAERRQAAVSANTALQGFHER